MIWSYKWLWKMIYRNLNFLKFLQDNNHNELFDKYSKIFIDNLKKLKPNFKPLLSNIPSECKKFYNLLVQDNEELKIKEDKKGIKTDKKSLSIFEPFYKWIEKGFELWEEYLWTNNFEVLQMILLIQSPYVKSIRDTIMHFLKTSLQNTSDEFKKLIVATAVYVLSMFADNYVAMVVWTDILTSSKEKWGLGMEMQKAISYVGKFAVNGWSAVVTWNSPNAILSKEWVPSFYLESSTKPSKDSLLTQIKEGKHEQKIWKMFSKVFWSMWILWVNIWEIMLDVYALHLMPSTSDLLKLKPEEFWKAIASLSLLASKPYVAYAS